MDINRIQEELRQQCELLEEAISSLQRLARRGAKRRGRPPLWLTEIKEKRGPGRPAGSKNRKLRDNAESLKEFAPPCDPPILQRTVHVQVCQQRTDDSPNAIDNFGFDRRLEFRPKSGSDVDADIPVCG